MSTPTFTPTTGDDLDALLNDNDAVGEWEQASSGAASIPRWMFPRFVPICHDCTIQFTLNPEWDQDDETSHEYECSSCGKGHEMDLGDKYLSRSGIGHDTDVETLAAWLSVQRNLVGCILIVGDPGTGKTALVEAACVHAERTLDTILCTPDHTKNDLLVRYVGDGNGIDGTPYVLGPVAHAAKYGHVLCMDEALLLVDGVKPILYSLADGRRFLPEGNVDGSALEIHEDFRLVLVSNPLVRGASLPEPLASRAASTTLTVETSAAMLTDLGIDESVVAAWEGLGTAGLWKPAIRELRLADFWLTNGQAGQAVSAFLPEHCPESQREAVRNCVVGYIGGAIRTDGRLVVS